MVKKMEKVKIYTDGACSGNPGIGGWAVAIIQNNNCKTFTGNEKTTTNNAMELIAVLKALQIILNDKIKNAVIFSDSAYVCNAINNGWLLNWRNNGWRTQKGEEIKNLDLWQWALQFLFECKEIGLHVEIKKIKGHSGEIYNELCDKLAKSEIKKIKNK